MHFSILERTKSDLSKIKWLRGIILLNPIVLVPWGRFFFFFGKLTLGQVSIVSHSYQTYFGFPGSDLNLDCGSDHVITRFASERLLLSSKVAMGFWVSFVCG